MKDFVLDRYKIVKAPTESGHWHYYLVCEDGSKDHFDEMIRIPEEKIVDMYLRWISTPEPL